MVQKLDTLIESPSQTAGPYVHIGTVPTYAGLGGIYEQEIGESPITEGAKGEVITITGTVADATGWVLRDAMFETWQPDAAGKFAGDAGADPAVSGWSRVCADPESGEWTLKTVKPGSTTLRDGRVQAPHISVWLVARGINIGLQTRIYFEDEDNSADPLLNRIEQRPRVDTLIAKRTGDGEYRFDIRIAGPQETVFLDI